MQKDYLALTNALTFEIAKRNAYCFLTNFAHTVDEHGDPQERVKLFPRCGDRYLCARCKISYELDFDPNETPFITEVNGKLEVIDLKPCPKCEEELQIAYAYLKVCLEVKQLRKKVAYAKSRQMMLSWAMVGYHFWLSVFHGHSLSMCQSMTELKAKELIKRLSDMQNNLPEFISSTFAKLNRPPSQLEYWWDNGSRIRALAKGVEQATGFTCSAYFCDEAAYQDSFRSVLAEVSPTLGGKGDLTLVSTPNGRSGTGEAFWRIVHDKKEDEA